MLVERENAVGGACVRTGTIPSKTLREHATRPRLHGEPAAVERPMTELLAGVADVVAANRAAYTTDRLGAYNLGTGVETSVNELYEMVARELGTTTVLGGKRVLRVTVMNPRTAERDVESVLEGLGRVGAGLSRG